jgi:hypothetical protein
VNGFGPTVQDNLPGSDDMYFLRSSDLDPSASGIHGAPGAIGVVVCSPLFWPAANQAESWSAIYRLAYEQLVAAFSPSKFQRSLEPSMN